MLKKILLFVSTAIWLAPFLLMLLIAFSSKNTNSFLELFADNRATFQNFQNAWEQAEFSRYFLNTVIVTVVSVVVILAVTALAGYIMGCFEFRAKKIIYTVMMISIILWTTKHSICYNSGVSDFADAPLREFFDWADFGRSRWWTCDFYFVVFKILSVDPKSAGRICSAGRGK